jgi:hypothetical protein
MPLSLEALFDRDRTGRDNFREDRLWTARRSIFCVARTEATILASRVGRLTSGSANMPGGSTWLATRSGGARWRWCTPNTMFESPMRWRPNVASRGGRERRRRPTSAAIMLRSLRSQSGAENERRRTDDPLWIRPSRPLRGASGRGLGLRRTKLRPPASVSAIERNGPQSRSAFEPRNDAGLGPRLRTGPRARLRPPSKALKRRQR